jgi:hypothetical protein
VFAEGGEKMQAATEEVLGCWAVSGWRAMTTRTAGPLSVSVEFLSLSLWRSLQKLDCAERTVSSSDFLAAQSLQESAGMRSQCRLGAEVSGEQDLRPSLTHSDSRGSAEWVLLRTRSQLRRYFDALAATVADWRRVARVAPRRTIWCV